MDDVYKDICFPTTTDNNKSKSKSAAKFKNKAGAKAVKTCERNAAGAVGVLNRQAATTYRTVSARANCLAADSGDGAYSSNERCRDFATPNNSSLSKLKRLGRYYVGIPRLVYRYDFCDKPVTEFDTDCDTDFVGCRITRRSTSGGCCMIADCQVKHRSKTQSTIALSSGEAELSGIHSGIARALGVQRLCADMGWTLKPWLHSNATAAIGIAKLKSFETNLTFALHRFVGSRKGAQWGYLIAEDLGH